MIDPNNINTVRVGQLVETIFSGTDNIPHEVGNNLRRGTINDLATYIAGIIGATGSLAFLPISVADGDTLPNTTENQWFLAGQGTYSQNGGYPDIVCVEELNVIIGDSNYWSLGFGIPIVIDPPDAMISQTVNAGVTNYSPSEDAVRQAIDNVTFLNAVGSFNYSDLATQTTPISITANTPTKLTNDALGAFTNTNFAPFGVSSTYNPTTNQFDFSELSLGDWIDFRTDLFLDLVGTNTSYKLELRCSIGSGSPWTLPVHNGERKSTDGFSETHEFSVIMEYQHTIDNPAELWLTPDAGASVKVNGWQTKVTRKNINIVNPIVAHNSTTGLNTGDFQHLTEAEKDKSLANFEILVASNDATNEQKSKADYVCDGISDEVQINLAIQSLAESRGGTVRLSQGRFSLSTPVIIDRMVALIGSGRGIKLSLTNTSTATDMRGTAIYQTTNSDVIKIQTVNKLQGFEIKDMMLVGYGRQNSPTGHGIHIAGGSDVSVMRNLSISDCYAGIFYNHDVTSQMLDTPWIDQCSIQRNHIGVLAIGAHLMRITNNIFWENYGIGSYGSYAFNCGGIGIQELGNHLITNNHFGESNFLEGTNGVKDSSHISLIYGEALISNNQFNKTNGNAIKLTGYTSYCKITSNHFANFGHATSLNDAQQSCIFIEGSQSNLISDNYMISTNGTYGIYEDITSFKNSFLNNIFNNLTAPSLNKIFSEGTDTYEFGTVVRPLLLPEKYVKIAGDQTINDNKTFADETYFSENIVAGGVGVSMVGISDLTGNLQGKSILIREDNLIDGAIIRPVPAPDGLAGDYDFHTFKNSVLNGNLFLQRLLGSVGIGTAFNGISAGKKLDVNGSVAVGDGSRIDPNSNFEVTSNTNALSIFRRNSTSNSNRMFFITGSVYNWFLGMTIGDSDFKISDEDNGKNRLRLIPGNVDSAIVIDGTTGGIVLTKEPTTSSSNYHILTRNSTTGVVEKVLTQPESDTLTTTTSITTSTLTDGGFVQKGKIVRIENGTNNINITVNGSTGAYVKGGTGTITFVQGSGRNLTGVNGTVILNGAVDSTVSLVSTGTIDKLYINNL